MPDRVSADFAAARLHMVDSQIRTNKVNDPTLIDAFLAVPREVFVPEALKGNAYVDDDLPIGEGRWLMEPMVLARLILAAAVTPEDRVLVAGAGPGYEAAVLARLAKTVIALDQAPALAGTKARLDGLGADGIRVVAGDLNQGWPTAAPYQVILIPGAVAEVPSALIDQLGDRGRLVTVVRPGDGPGQAVVLERTPYGVGRRNLFEAGTPRLPGCAPVPGFKF